MAHGDSAHAAAIDVHRPASEGRHLVKEHRLLADDGQLQDCLKFFAVHGLKGHLVPGLLQEVA